MRALLAISMCLALLGALSPHPAAAAEPMQWRTGAPAIALPFPRSERAQSVWQSGACWSQCGAYCAWGQNECLHVDAQDQCLAWTDRCDRQCQRTCRTSGGPLIPDLLDF